MVKVSNWIDHLSAAEVKGAVYPGVGTEGLLVLIAFVIWIGWHVMQSQQESEELAKLAKRRPSSNAWKSNVTDG